MKTVNVPCRCGGEQCTASLGLTKENDFTDEIEIIGCIRTTKDDLLNALMELEDDDNAC